MEQTIENLIRSYGLIAVFFGGATEGDGTLVVSGALAHMGYFNFIVATLVGCLGAFAIDVAWYTLGRTRAESIRSSRLYTRAGATVERIASRIGAWQVVIARFIFGARIPTMIFWGMQREPLARFIALDLIGCLAWGAVLSSLGYAFSTSLASLLSEVKRTERHLVIVLAAGVVVFVAHALLSHRLRRLNRQTSRS